MTSAPVRVPTLLVFVRAGGVAVVVCAVTVIGSVTFCSDAWFASGGLNFALGAAAVLGVLLALAVDFGLGRRRRVDFVDEGIVYHGAVGAIRVPRREIQLIAIEAGVGGSWTVRLAVNGRPWVLQDLQGDSTLPERIQSWASTSEPQLRSR